MKLIVGLGNPGSQYAHTRHNVGFTVVDALAARLEAPAFKLDKKTHAEVAETVLDGEKIILAKPQTFMNLSGKAVQALLNEYRSGGLTLDDLWVIHDEIDFDADKFQVRHGGSAGGFRGQMGLRSIIDVLGEDFWRVRVGIGKNDRTTEPSEVYVMKPLDEATRAMIDAPNGVVDQIITTLTGSQTV